MRKLSFRSALTAAALGLALAPAPLALAGQTHGYPQVVHGDRFESESYSERSWSSEDGGYAGAQANRDAGYWDGGDSDEDRWSDGDREQWADRDGAADSYGHRFSHRWRYGDDGDVGYLPLGFFADGGGVGPAYVDYGGYGGGGYVYAVGGAGAFAGARASASVSARVSIIGGFRGHGGFHHQGGRGCGCK
jgi:hypothetical protein